MYILDKLNAFFYGAVSLVFKLFLLTLLLMPFIILRKPPEPARVREVNLSSAQQLKNELEHPFWAGVKVKARDSRELSRDPLWILR